MKRKTFALVVLAGLCCSVGAVEQKPDGTLVDELPPSAGWSVLGVALGPARGIAYPAPDCDVKGFRWNLLVGHHRTMSGLDLGVFGNWTDGALDGLSIAGLGTWCGEANFGVHFASVMNYAEGAFNGVQLGMVNSACTMRGLQLGLVNATSDGAGVQLGVWNLAEEFRGLQLGLCNIAHTYKGVQFGVGNIIGESPLTACILMNIWF